MKAITSSLWEILAVHITDDERRWLKSKENGLPFELMTAFVAAPRHLPKKQLSVANESSEALTRVIEGFTVNDWSVVRTARVWLLSLIDPTDKDAYVQHIKTLFDTAEMNELVALYSALPILSYPETWLPTATDAVRSNIGLVLDAIALQNPYPSRYFPQNAWNQLVMKTIFNDKPIHLIHGIEERANSELARILTDFAHERWAAGRRVAPQVWRLLVKFVSDATLSDLKHLLESPNADDREAGALVCLHSFFPPAQELLTCYPATKELAMKGAFSWKNLEQTDLNTYVS